MSTQWHEQSSLQVLRVMGVDKDNGLTEKEARARLEKFGPNELPRKKSAGWFIILLRQFASPFMYILIFAAIVSIAFADWVDAGVIAAAIIVNSIVGFIQEYKASEALEKLRSMVQPKVHVRRQGEDKMVDARKVVPGDILILESGDHIAADARVLVSHSLEVNEAALTGESLPISKSDEPVVAGTVLAERKDMVYTGTVVTNGRGRAVVVATALDTELGKIAKMVKETKEEKTPLQVQLARLARVLTFIFVGISLLIFAFGVAVGRSVFEMFLTAVALAVAAVPEGLLVAVTAIFAIGMQRILKRRALVRRLVATETLGSVSVICTDKTGTITEARMEVSDIVSCKEILSEKKLDDAELTKEAVMALKIAALCNDAVVSHEEEGLEKLEITGSPTEVALMRSAIMGYLEKWALDEEYERFFEIPFDSKNKYMATLNTWTEKSRAILLKGAPEVVIDFCDKVCLGNEEQELTEVKRQLLLKRAKEMTRRGLRVLSVAYKKVSGEKEAIDGGDLKNCVFVGLFGLRDPIRVDAKETVEKARKAGVRTVIITGDHPDTAIAIAKEAGVSSNRERTMLGREIDQLSDDELREKVEGVDVYARVEPAHKVRIVNAWRQSGAVVAMTGDGVNDAPALKAADIGVALGTGTDVAKETADIVLLDNALTTIIAAIEQGRVIFDNIRKTTVFLLANGFTEMILVGGAVLMGYPLPLLPAQILWVNLITDGFPSVALTFEPGDPNVMKEPPRPRTEAILNRDMKMLIFLIAVIADLVLFAIFLYLFSHHPIEYIRTIMFTAVAISSLIYVFSIKSFRHSIIHTNIFSNRLLVIGVMVGLGLQIMVVTVPFFQHVFDTVPLHLYDWLLLVMIGSVKFVVIETAKWFFIVKKHKIKIHTT